MGEQEPTPKHISDQGNNHILPESGIPLAEHTPDPFLPDETPITPSSFSRQARIIEIEDNQVKMLSPTGRKFTLSNQEYAQQLVNQQMGSISNLKEALEIELTELEEVTGIKGLSQTAKTNLEQLRTVKAVYLTGYKLTELLEPKVMNDPETTRTQKREMVKETIKDMGEANIILEDSRTQISLLDAQQTLLALAGKLLQPKFLGIFAPKVPKELLPIVIKTIENFSDTAMIALAARFEPAALTQGLNNVKLISEAGEERAKALAKAGEAEKRERAETENRKEMAAIKRTQLKRENIINLFFDEETGLIVKASRTLSRILTNPVIAGGTVGLAVGGAIGIGLATRTTHLLPPWVSVAVGATIFAIPGAILGKKYFPPQTT